MYILSIPIHTQCLRDLLPSSHYLSSVSTSPQRLSITPNAACLPQMLQPRELERKEESQRTHRTAPTRRHDSSAFKYPHNGKFRKLGSGESHQFSKPSIICSM